MGSEEGHSELPLECSDLPTNWREREGGREGGREREREGGREREREGGRKGEGEGEKERE